MRPILYSASRDSTNIRAWDPLSGLQVSSVETRGRIPPCGVAVAPTTTAFVASAATKQHLTLSYLNSAKSVQCATAECMGPVALTADGVFLATGGCSGKVYLWQTCSGNLLRSWRGHYKSVTALRFVRGDSCLVSGGEDALICVWPLSQLVGAGQNAHAQAPAVPPMYTWTGHSLPITYLWCEKGYGRGQWRIVSSSCDHTCKVWNLSLGNRRCTCSFVFPASVNCAVLDTQDTLYAGGEDGIIAVVDFANSQAQPSALATRRIPGFDCQVAGGPCSCATGPTRSLLRSRNNAPVTCLEFMVSRSVLVSGHGDGSASYFFVAPDPYWGGGSQIVVVGRTALTRISALPC